MLWQSLIHRCQLKLCSLAMKALHSLGPTTLLTVFSQASSHLSLDSYRSISGSLIFWPYVGCHFTPIVSAVAQSRYSVNVCRPLIVPRSPQHPKSHTNCLLRAGTSHSSQSPWIGAFKKREWRSQPVFMKHKPRNSRFTKLYKVMRPWAYSQREDSN